VRRVWLVGVLAIGLGGVSLPPTASVAQELVQPAAEDAEVVVPPGEQQTGRLEGPTALCWDGWTSYSRHVSRTCSQHGGVEYWTNPLPPSVSRD
jgi:hypothetical protein